VLEQQQFCDLEHALESFVFQQQFCDLEHALESFVFQQQFCDLEHALESFNTKPCQLSPLDFHFLFPQ
jgi:hypothetical protein